MTHRRVGFRTMLAGSALLLAATVSQATPTQVVTSGLLLDAQDAPVTGAVPVRFSLHAGPSTSVLWSATYTVVFQNGRYAVTLGDQTDAASTPLDDALLAGADVYLGVEVGGTALLPRQRLAAVPRAQWAQVAALSNDAQKLGGRPPADYALTTHLHDDRYLQVSDALASYQAKGSYLTTADAVAAYQPKGSYLTAAAAATSYQPKGDYVTTAGLTAALPQESAVSLSGSALGGAGSSTTGWNVSTDGLTLAGQAASAGGTDLEVLNGQTITLPDTLSSYRNITVRTGGTLTVNTWTGSAGGKALLRASGTFTLESGASLTVKGKGYRGGTSLWARANPGQAGESPGGVGSRVACTRNGGGGGGGQTDAGNYGQAGAGGGYGTAGATGYRYVYAGCDAEGGSTYGDEDLTTLHLGAAGGSGGTDADQTGKGGDGGNGGGAVSIEASSIVVAGTIDASGNNGGNAQTSADNGGGGGGAGGSVLLHADSIDFRSTGTISVAGGSGGTGMGANPGGAGGFGRVLLKGLVIQNSGTINGTARKIAPGASGPFVTVTQADWTSPAVTLPSGVSLQRVDVFATRSATAGLVVEVCVAATEAATSDASCFKPVAPSGVVLPGTSGTVSRVRVKASSSTSQAFAISAVRWVYR